MWLLCHEAGKEENNDSINGFIHTFQQNTFKKNHTNADGSTDLGPSNIKQENKLLKCKMFAVFGAQHVTHTNVYITIQQ